MILHIIVKNPPCCGSDHRRRKNYPFTKNLSRTQKSRQEFFGRLHEQDQLHLDWNILLVEIDSLTAFTNFLREISRTQLIDIDFS